MKFAILTFGCRVNLADSLAIERGLRARGDELAEVGAADVVIVNTCAVTGAAEHGARNAIRRVARANPAARLTVTGCYATRQPSAVAALPGVVRVVPNGLKEGLGGSMAAGRRDGAGQMAAPRPGVFGRTVYTLRVQTGCDGSCTYCIVPATRGPGRSMPPAGVVDEVERIAAAGFREMMLTGVHLGSYGRDLSPRSSLAGLLGALDRRVSHGRLLIRVGSIEPMDVTRAVEERLAGSPAFAPHFHLPMQHGSNRVLRAMRRPYTIERYMALVERLRQLRPSAAIGADVIVGFPGERDGDMRALGACLGDAPLSYLHVFPYSERPGTEAASLPGRVPGPVVRQRVEEVRAIGRRLSARFRASQVGSVRDGLTTGDGSVVLTDNYLKVQVAGRDRPNRRVRVRITADGTPMAGEIVTADGAAGSLQF